MVFVGVATLVLIVFALWMNLQMKRMPFYENQFRYSYDFPKKKSDVEMMALGSTYAQFAFQSIARFSVKADNCAMYSRPIEYDYKILKRKIKFISKGARVILFLSPCVLLLSEAYEDESGNHNAVLLPWELNRLNIKLWLKVNIPALQRKNWRSFFALQPPILSLDEKYLSEIGNNNPSRNAELREMEWKRQFGVKDLKTKVNNEILEQNIQHNIEYIRRMNKICVEKGCSFIIVIPPFSNILNQKFSDEFCASALNVPLRSMMDEVVIYDYRKEKTYQDRTDLFVDGCFLLNQTGSVVFLNNLLSDIMNNY